MSEYSDRKAGVTKEHVALARAVVDQFIVSAGALAESPKRRGRFTAASSGSIEMSSYCCLTPHTMAPRHLPPLVGVGTQRY